MEENASMTYAMLTMSERNVYIVMAMRITLVLVNIYPFHQLAVVLPLFLAMFV